MHEITEAVISYIKRPDTNYAVMINGGWGVGKTFYWENTLKKEIESITNYGKKLKTIYLSLYGISSVEEIGKKIFFDKYTNNIKFPEGKLKNGLSVLGKMVLPLAKNFEVVGMKLSDISISEYEDLLDFENIVLCFDDLERSNLDIVTVMGYINNFVEHDHAKVIILSNEEEISNVFENSSIELKTIAALSLAKKIETKNEQQNINDEVKKYIIDLFGDSNDYKRMKEKLIGITLSYNPNKRSQIQSILDSIEDGEVREFLNQNIDEIMPIIIRSENGSFRIIQRTLDDYQTIYNTIKLKNVLLINTELPLVLLRSLLVMSIEIRSGLEEQKFLSEVRSGISITHANFQVPERKEEYGAYINLFLKRYFEEDNFDSFLFFKFIEILIRHGYIEEDIYLEEISPYERMIDEAEPRYNIFKKNNYQRLSDSEFIVEMNAVYEMIKNGEIPFNLYYSMFNFYLRLIEEGIFNKELSVFVSEMNEGLEKSANNTENEPMSVRVYSISEEGIQKDFFEKASILNKQMKDRIHKQNAEKWLNLIDTDFESFEKSITEGTSGAYYIKYLKAEDLIDKIKNMNNLRLVKFTTILSIGFKENDFGDLLDNSFMESLVRILEEYIDQREPSLSKLNLKILAKLIKDELKINYI